MEIINVESIDDLPEVAEKIINRLDNSASKVVAFYGAMGAGKTTLIREICLQLGVVDTVTSPTFALINQYKTVSGHLVNHFDFYRIEKLEEAFDMGYEEYFYSGDICLVEWPEKIEDLLPDNTLTISININPDDNDSRTIIID